MNPSDFHDDPVRFQRSPYTSQSAVPALPSPRISRPALSICRCMPPVRPRGSGTWGHGTWRNLVRNLGTRNLGTDHGFSVRQSSKPWSVPYCPCPIVPSLSTIRSS